MIWSKIEDRFRNFSAAFRYFDLNYNNKITFNEFAQCMESINLKMPVRDQFACFQFLDKENKSYVNYEDFCCLSDSHRRNIDPASEIIKAFKNSDDAARKVIKDGSAKECDFPGAERN